MKKNLAGRYKITNRGTIIVNNIRITKSEYSRYKELNRLVENKRRRLERKGDVYFGKQVRSLRIYETKAEFNAQVRKLERYLQPNYVMTRDKILFENYKQKVRDVFADEKMKRQMITKIFKISTKEMFTFKNKSELIVFVYEVTGSVPANATINDLTKMLPKKDYCRVK